ncbi:MFS general substrate transporter [Melanogaster broomeanus]|nr:MFS general substrate transporter [Melanogaster broomeanus]
MNFKSKLPFGLGKSTRRRRLLLVLLFPVMLETLDYTVVATAQSRIASVFNALSLQSYIATAYLLASTVFLPFFASIADIYGRHFGLQISLLWFLVGSALSTGAVNMPMVLVGRGIAGVGAAGLLTIVLTLMSDTGSLNANNVQQSGLFILYGTAYTIGPWIGRPSGLLLTSVGLPCTALAMLLCFTFLRNKSRAVREGEGLPSNSPADTWISKLVLIDWIGMFLFVAGGILVLLALGWGPDDNWETARVIANVIIGVILIILCLIWEIVLERKHLRLPCPSMIPIEMFTSYDMCVTQYGSFVSGVVMFVMFYFVAIFATIVTGLPPSEAGIQLLYFAPGLVSYFRCPVFTSSHFHQGGKHRILLTVNYSPSILSILGTVIMPVGIGLSRWLCNGIYRQNFMAMAGVGVGLIVGPLVIQARFTKPNHVAIVNAMLLFFRSLGGTVGLAQCFTVMNAKVKSYILNQINTGALSGSDLASLVGLIDSGGLSSVTTLDGLPTAVQTVIREAFQNAVRWSFISLIPWLGVASILSVFLSKIPDTDLDPQPQAQPADVEKSPQTRAPDEPNAL